MSQVKEYQQISAEVKEFDKVILREMEKRTISKKANPIKKYYKGVTILLSPLQLKPKVLILGINPGSGYYKVNNNTPVRDFDPIATHEYFEEDYCLASQMKYIFNRIDKIDLLKESVKSNVCYFATNNERELGLLKQSLPGNLKNDFDAYINKWTMKLIDVVSPEIILCEGVSAFNYITNIESMKIHTIKNGVRYSIAYSEKYKIIACRRLFSNILHKKAFANKLKVLIEE